MSGTQGRLGSVGRLGNGTRTGSSRISDRRLYFDAFAHFGVARGTGQRRMGTHGDNDDLLVGFLGHCRRRRAYVITGMTSIVGLGSHNFDWSAGTAPEAQSLVWAGRLPNQSSVFQLVGVSSTRCPISLEENYA